MVGNSTVSVRSGSATRAQLLNKRIPARTGCTVRRAAVVTRAQQGGGRFDERRTEVRRLVKRDLEGSSRDAVEEMSINAAESTPKSLDELEKLFEDSDIESLKVEGAKTSDSSSAVAASPFASAGGAAKSSNPFGSTSTKAAASPFGTASAKGSSAGSPFGASSSSPFAGSSAGAGSSPFGKASGIQEPKGLSPNMTADPVTDEPAGPFAFLGGLKAAQIVTVISFTLIIALMLGTFKVVLDSGAIHFNE